MKQSISPTVAIIIILVVIVLVAAIGWFVMKGKRGSAPGENEDLPEVAPPPDTRTGAPPRPAGPMPPPTGRR